MIVMKFGGSSVDTAEAIERVEGIVRGRLERRPVVVVSAMAKTTRDLLESAAAAAAGEGTQVHSLFDQIELYHRREAYAVVPPAGRPALDARLDPWFNELRTRLDDLINHHKLVLNSLDRKVERGGPVPTDLEQRRHREKRDLEELRRAFKATLAEGSAVEQRFERGANAYWGLVFKEGNENSRFGEQVQDYADLYTSRVSNFLYYSPMQVFRSPRATMPHERNTVRGG